MQNKLKSKALWVSILSLIGILVKAKYPLISDDWDNFVTVILSGLITLGILNDYSNTNTNT